MKPIECVFVDALLRESKDNTGSALGQGIGFAYEYWSDPDFPTDSQLTLFDSPSK
jgi:hypothetical protein